MKFLLIKLDNDENMDDVIAENQDNKDSTIFLCRENKNFEEFRQSNRYTYDVYKLNNNKLQGPMIISISNSIYEGIPTKSIENMNYFLDKHFKKEDVKIKKEKVQEDASASTPLLFQYGSRSSSSAQYSSISNDKTEVRKLKME